MRWTSSLCKGTRESGAPGACYLRGHLYMRACDSHPVLPWVLRLYLPCGGSELFYTGRAVFGRGGLSIIMFKSVYQTGLEDTCPTSRSAISYR